jgi:HK97 gp10 family phage protein
VKLNITIKGADELAAALDQAPQGTEQVIATGNAAAAPIIKASTQRETPVRTGFLRSSEDVLVRGSRLEFRAEAPYASYVAYGTSRQRANPFPDRGVAAAEPEVIREFEQAANVFVREFEQ